MGEHEPVLRVEEGLRALSQCPAGGALVLCGHEGLGVPPEAQVDRVLCFTWHSPDQVGPDVDRAAVTGEPQHGPDVGAAYSQGSAGRLGGIPGNGRFGVGEVRGDGSGSGGFCGQLEPVWALVHGVVLLLLRGPNCKLNIIFSYFLVYLSRADSTHSRMVPTSCFCPPG